MWQPVDTLMSRSSHTARGAMTIPQSARKWMVMLSDAVRAYLVRLGRGRRTALRAGCKYVATRRITVD